MISRVMIGGFIGDVLHAIGYVYVTGDPDDPEPVLSVRMYPAILNMERQEDDDRRD